MKDNRILFILLGVVVLLMIVLLVSYFFSSGEPTFEELAAVATNTKLEDDVREKAMVDLADKGEKAAPILEKIYKDSSSSPRLRAAAILGLGGIRKWESMPTILDALEDSNELVRGRAGAVAYKFIGRDYPFHPGAPANQRKKIIRQIRQCYEEMDEAKKKKEKSKK